MIVFLTETDEDHIGFLYKKNYILLFLFKTRLLYLVTIN